MTGLVQFAHRLLNTFAQPNGVALRTEHHAVERVGNNHEGQLLRLRQAAAEKIGLHLSFSVDAETERRGQVGKFGTVLLEAVVLKDTKKYWNAQLFD